MNLLPLGIKTMPRLRQKANKPWPYECSICCYDISLFLLCVVRREFYLRKLPGLVAFAFSLFLELKIDYKVCFNNVYLPVSERITVNNERDNDRWAGVNISLPDFTLNISGVF